MMIPTKKQYVLVDFENVQVVDLDRIKTLPVKVVFFVGANQKSVSVDLFRKACAIPGCVEVVESVGSGKNAARVLRALSLKVPPAFEVAT